MRKYSLSEYEHLIISNCYSLLFLFKFVYKLYIIIMSKLLEDISLLIQRNLIFTKQNIGTFYLSNKKFFE